MKKLFFGIWFLLTILLYVWTEHTIAKTSSFEASIAFNIYLCILTFPIGFFVPILWILITYPFEGTHIGAILENGHIANFLIWIIFVAIGYWQWFILAPKIVTKVGIRNKKHSPLPDRLK